jgi:peptide deformylase
VSDLIDTMLAAQGAGLAAPQIGVDLQVVVFGSGAPNPRYPKRPWCAHGADQPVVTPWDEDWEGCLSVPLAGGGPPGAPCPIQRTGRLAIGRAQSSFHARVVQHECDHLWGKLYPVRVRDFPLRLHR